jgi:DNA-binding transcriptional LysR family regulator
MKPFCYHPFDLRQFVSFAEIARTGSFRQTAKTLHIAQPALSRQIKQLEAALGISLFDRTPPRLHLTIEGRELASRLPALFSQIDHLAKTVKAVSAGGTAQLRIGDGGAVTTEVICAGPETVAQALAGRESFIRSEDLGRFLSEPI